MPTNSSSENERFERPAGSGQNESPQTHLSDSGFELGNGSNGLPNIVVGNGSTITTKSVIPVAPVISEKGSSESKSGIRVSSEHKSSSMVSDETILSNAPPLPVGSSIFLKEGSRVSPPDSLAPEEYRTSGTLPLGMTLGHFSITKYIGGGGMGRVYEGLDLALDRKVAIKVLPPQRANDGVSVARFLNEAKSAARLNHEHIAQVYFCGEEKGIPFIAFEYVEGINVRDYVMTNGVLPLPQAINFVLQIADALAHAAVHGVTHRDVKPSNILITPLGQAKLIDMGLARLFKTSDPDDDLTASGVTLGTFDYISPEQARDPRDADVRSDIYSLGCTFFFMLTGQPPFPEGTVLQKLLKHQGDIPPDVRVFSPNTPPEVAGLIQKMMAKNPKDRFQTPKQLMEVLIDIAELVGLRPPAPGQTAWQLPEVRTEKGMWRHFPWIASVTLLLICVFFIQSIGSRPRNSILPVLPGITQPRTMGTIPSPPGTGPEPVKPGTVEEEKILSGGNLLAPQIRILDATLLSSVYSDKSGAHQKTTAMGENGETESTEESFILAPPERIAGGFDILPASSTAAAKETGLLSDESGQSSPALFLGIPQPGDSLSWSGNSGERQESLVSTTSAASPEPLVTTGILVVDGRGERTGTYVDVASALASVASQESSVNETGSGDIKIELRFNGNQELASLAFPARSITLYAADGFTPQLSYRTTESTSGGTGERMFLLSGTQLLVRGITLDLVVPVQDVVATEWSMFEFMKSSTLTIENSRLQIRNTMSESDFSPLHQNVAFFRETKSNPGSAAAGFDSQRPDASHAIKEGSDITLSMSDICGEANLFRTSIQVSSKLKLSDCGVNITGALYRYDQNEVTVARGQATELLLNHDLIVCGDAIARHEQKDEHQYLFPLAVNMMGSVVKLNDTPFMTVVAPGLPQDIVNVSSWNFNGTLLLNVTGYLRFRDRQNPDEFTDQPLSYSLPERNLRKLAPDAATKIADTPPHLFTRDDFYQTLCLALDSVLTDPVEKQTLNNLKTRFLGP